MRRTRRLITSMAVVVLALGAWAAPTVRAQSTECGLLTVEEANAALGVTDLSVSQGGTAFCGFSGATTNLILGVTLGQTLDDVQGTGGEDLTVADLPAHFDASGTQLSVQHATGLLGVYAYGSSAASVRDALIAIAELAIPRLPAGPDPADMERLEALLPDTLGGEPLDVQSFTGDIVLGFRDPTEAPVIALNEALAALGKTASDILLVGGDTESTEDESSVVAILIKGVDAAALLQPLFSAFVSDGEAATFTPQQIGGKNVIVVETPEQTQVAYPSGDIILAITASAEETEAILAAAP